MDLKTSVLFDMDQDNIRHYDAVVFDTDSRSISPEEAYQRVSRAAQFLTDAGFDTIFKKIGLHHARQYRDRKLMRYMMW